MRENILAYNHSILYIPIALKSKVSSVVLQEDFAVLIHNIIHQLQEVAWNQTKASRRRRAPTARKNPSNRAGKKFLSG
jgi:hypothetical protein